MTTWTIALGLDCVCSGGFSDELDIDWLAKRSSETFEPLSASPRNSPTPLGANEAIDCWRKLVGVGWVWFTAQSRSV